MCGWFCEDEGGRLLLLALDALVCFHGRWLELAFDGSGFFCGGSRGDDGLSCFGKSLVEVLEFVPIGMSPGCIGSDGG